MVPFYWPKTWLFEHIFPPDVIMDYDSKAGWALYYVPCLNASFIVIDVRHGWKINHYIGRLNVTYTANVMEPKMAQLRATGCCGDD